MSVVLARLRATPPRTIGASALVFVALGFVMNALGHALSLAWFRHWGQVLPCYLGYVLPLALLVRGRPLATAWTTSILAFIPLELCGYALGTSVIADGNVIARLLGPHNFTLAMVLLVSPTPLVGNAVVDVALRLWPPPPPPSAP
ncbi:MAG: hypothetical protein FJ137_11015 [Deltaproteobacteria bacterium]|nr:hypothetical protein [Deltaproteobacteria bacterium]